MKNCKDYLLILDEYIYGDLDQTSAIRVSTHIADCPLCAGEYEILRGEQRLYGQYLLDLEPTPALWARVRADIEEVQRGGFSRINFRGWLMRAFSLSPLPVSGPAFLLLIMFGIIVGIIKYNPIGVWFSEEITSQASGDEPFPGKLDNYAKKEASDHDRKSDTSRKEDEVILALKKKHNKKDVSRSEPTRLPYSRSRNVNRKLTTPEEVERAESKYRQAVAMLSYDLQRRRKQLSQDLDSKLEKSLSDIDQTISETRRAVRAHPGDPQAIQYMTTAYSRKIELLRTIFAD